MDRERERLGEIIEKERKRKGDDRRRLDPA